MIGASILINYPQAQRMRNMNNLSLNQAVPMKIRETDSPFKIALLATGDEICNGDILNTNSREIAQRLTDLGMQIGIHAVTSDSIAETKKTIHFLLQSHQALIMTGGLGPTSDDLTRYALTEVLNKPLVFDETTWNDIVIRLKNFGYPTPPDSNRQQALFPEGAVIIPNPNGTASGCVIKNNNQFIFMLPGPPPECMPMIDNTVIPILKENHFQQQVFHRSWMLFGVSEGQIAEELDSLAKPYECMTGYRIVYPYIEFKIHSTNEIDFTEVSKKINTLVTPYLISEGKQSASDHLKKILETSDIQIQICDSATKGLLENILSTPKTYKKILFTDKKYFSPEIPAFSISGLDEFWQQLDAKKSLINLEFDFNQQHEKLKFEAPYRGLRVKHYALEWISYQITQLILKYIM